MHIDIKKYFEGYKNLTTRFDDFKNGISNYIEIEGSVNNLHIVYKNITDVKVAVTLEDVVLVLEKYISKQIDEIELKWWASLLISLDEYEIFADYIDETREALIDILHKISSSEIFEDITHKNLIYNGFILLKPNTVMGKTSKYKGIYRDTVINEIFELRYNLTNVSKNIPVDILQNILDIYDANSDEDIDLLKNYESVVEINNILKKYDIQHFDTVYCEVDEGNYKVTNIDNIAEGINSCKFLGYDVCIMGTSFFSAIYDGIVAHSEENRNENYSQELMFDCMKYSKLLNSNMFFYDYEIADVFRTTYTSNVYSEEGKYYIVKLYELL